MTGFRVVQADQREVPRVNLGIKQKLIGGVVLALVAMTAVFVVVFPERQRNALSASLADKSAVMARIVAHGASAGLLFGDEGGMGSTPCLDNAVSKTACCRSGWT